MSITTSHDTITLENVKIVPMSFAQQRLWFLNQLEPDSTIYNISRTISTIQQLDLAIFQQCINTLVQRHEVLRTTFQMMEGQPMQVIMPTLVIPLSVVDLRDFPEFEQEAEAARLATEEVRRSFDLALGPLVRITLQRLGTGENRLLLTIHQIISDDWSLSMLLGELTTLYEVFLNSQSVPLSELSMQYADFALRQQQALQEGKLAEHLAYWKQQLAGSPELLNLPTDRPRSSAPTLRCSTYCLTLSRTLSNALKEQSHQEDMTLYMTLLGAFQVFLYRHTGQDDLVIGAIAVERPRVETEAMIGPLANTLVLRTNLSGNPTFGELLERVREVILEAQAHQDLPFEYLIRELQPTSPSGHNSLFQVMLKFESSLSSLPSAWTSIPMEISTGASRFDLTLSLSDIPEGGLTCHFEYSTDLFDRSTIVHLAERWQILLESIVADHTQHIASLQLLSSIELHQLLVEWNATHTEYPKDRCIHQLFEEQVERTPEAVAVVFQDRQLTYKELNARSNQLAHYLCTLGVGPDVLVGIYVERSLDMVVGLLGILKAGGAYLPLDPDYPSERIAFMLEDAQVPVLVTQKYLTARLTGYMVKVVCLDTDDVLLGQQSETDLLSATTSANLAYVIYTSGSTGRPKGVQIIQRSLVNFLLSAREQPGLNAEDTLLAVTTLSFDIAALELFLPLVVGARVIVAGREVVADGTALIEILTRTHATVMQATPVTWRILLAGGWQGNHCLRALCTGEPLPLELARQLLPKVALLWNLYGPTETTIWSSICKVDLNEESIFIGRPLANTQIYLLDAYLQPVPIGVPGELFIGGDGLARGYLNRPELTAERFIPHPFTDEPGARLYRTGDLVRYRSDGTIEHLGRLDFQVKLRGFRIELGEIETVLSRHFAVRQVVVVACENEPGDKRLVAYVVLHKEHTITENDLKDYMAKQVPTYMVPSVFVLLEMLPVTLNGKIDRRALPVPAFNKRVVKATFVAPILPVHHQLTQIWEDLLGVQSIGIKDDFFDLGGHSLLAVLLIDRIAQVYGKKLPLSILFAGATIEHLATVLMENTEVDARAPLVAVQAGGSRQPFFYLHGEWNGGAFYSRELARRLGSEQPFYLLEPYKFDDLPILPTFEAIAAAHLKSLRTVQPTGPYLLGGYCNGGLVAYELARQLRAQGQKVDLLVMIDSDAPVPARRRMMRRVINGVGNLLQLKQDKQFDLFLEMQHVYRYLRFAHYRFLKNSELMKNAWSGEPVFERNMFSFGSPGFKLKALFPRIQALRQEYLNIYDWVLLKYIPDLYPDRITFFWTYEELWRSTGWQEVVKAKKEEVEIHVVPGNHMTSRTEYLPILADHLCDCINKVQTDDQGGIL